MNRRNLITSHKHSTVYVINIKPLKLCCLFVNFPCKAMYPNFVHFKTTYFYIMVRKTMFVAAVLTINGFLFLIYMHTWRRILIEMWFSDYKNNIIFIFAEYQKHYVLMYIWCIFSAPLALYKHAWTILKFIYLYIFIYFSWIYQPDNITICLFHSMII